jgi:hypothetical protein
VGNTAVQVVAKKIPTIVRPPGDKVGDAPLVELNQTYSGTTFGGFNDYGLVNGSCFSTAPGGGSADAAPGIDVVLRFRAPTDGSYSFHVRGTPDTSVNYVLYLASAAPPGPTPENVACSSAANRTSNGGGEVLDGVNLTAGQEVFVFVDRADAGDGVPFLFEVTRPQREVESNDTPATAQAQTCGIHGVIDAGTADFHSLGSPAADSRVFAMADASGSTSTDADLRVTSGSDTLEYDDNNADAPFGAQAGLIAGTPAVGGPAYLRVSGFGAGTVVNPYRLYSVVQPDLGSATSESEPNGTTANADTSGINYFSGALADASDADVQRITVPAGVAIFAALDGDPTRNATPLDGKLELLDADGHVLVSVNDGVSTSNNSAGPGLTATTPNSPAEGLVYRTPSAGTYYLRVTSGAPAPGPTATGDYLLSASLDCTAGAAPEIADATLPDATRGAPYQHAFAATGAQGGAHWSVTGGSLPAGLSLGDGGTLSGTPTAAGDSSFEVRVVDGRGFPSRRSFSLHVNPASSPPGDTIAPTVTAFRFATNSFSWGLSEPAAVRIAIARKAAGRRRAGRCVKPTHKLRRKPRCTRHIATGALKATGVLGANRLAFDGKLGGKRLTPGKYRATLVATDVAGNRSKAARTTFSVKRK